MPMVKSGPKVGLTVAGGDLGWLMSLLRAMQGTFAVTIVHDPHSVSTLALGSSAADQAAVVELRADSSALDVRALLERSPNVRFVFIADGLPVRHAVARVIREGGHVVVARAEPAFVIAATVTALLAPAGSAP